LAEAEHHVTTSVADKQYRIAFCAANSSECDATAFSYCTNSNAKITHGLSLYHQPICLWHLEMIKGWITVNN